MQVGGKAGEEEEDRRRGSPARLQPRGFGISAGAARGEGAGGFCCFGGDDSRGVLIALLSSKPSSLSWSRGGVEDVGGSWVPRCGQGCA